MNLILLGYRGSGKSSLGAYLSKRWEMEFLDTDDRIVELSDQSIPEIFKQNGEQVFRDFETRVLKEAILKENVIIATGGGIVEREENRVLIANQNCGLYLFATSDTLYKRIKGDRNRPALTELDGKQEVELVLRRRDPWYRESARWVVNTKGYNLLSMERFLRTLGYP